MKTTALTLEQLEDRLTPSGSGLPDGDDKRLTAALRAAEASARGPAPSLVRPTPLPVVRVGDVVQGKGVPPAPPPPGALPPVVPVPLIERALVVFNMETELAVSLNTKVEDLDPKAKFLGAFDTRSGRWVSFLRPRPPRPLGTEPVLVSMEADEVDE